MIIRESLVYLDLFGGEERGGECCFTFFPDGIHPNTVSQDSLKQPEPFKNQAGSPP